MKDRSRATVFNGQRTQDKMKILKKVKDNYFSMYMYTLDNTYLLLTLGWLCMCPQMKLSLSQLRFPILLTEIRSEFLCYIKKQ